MSWLFSSPTISVTLKFNNSQRQVPVVDEQKHQKLIPLFTELEKISGQVTFLVAGGGKYEHQGIKLELVGQIETSLERGQPSRFYSLTAPMASAGCVNQKATFDFAFTQAERQYESYEGIHCRVRYFVRVCIAKSYGSPSIKDFPFAVQRAEGQPKNNPMLKMEVGIEDCLHIEFQYKKRAYSLEDVISGKIFFLLVKIKIKYMELQIKRKEVVGTRPNQTNKTDIVAKYEIMDGAPIKGEVIPIRLYLKGYPLTVSMPDVHKKFTVTYYINLVLIDDENRSYFKQQEIEIYRDKLTYHQSDKSVLQKLHFK